MQAFIALVLVAVATAELAPLYENSEPITGKYIIKLRDEFNVDEIAATVRLSGGKVGNIWRSALNGFAADLSDDMLEMVPHISEKPGSSPKVGPACKKTCCPAFNCNCGSSASPQGGIPKKSLRVLLRLTAQEFKEKIRAEFPSLQGRDFSYAKAGGDKIVVPLPPHINTPKALKEYRQIEFPQSKLYLLPEDHHVSSDTEDEDEAQQEHHVSSDTEDEDEAQQEMTLSGLEEDSDESTRSELEEEPDEVRDEQARPLQHVPAGTPTVTFGFPVGETIEQTRQIRDASDMEFEESLRRDRERETERRRQREEELEREEEAREKERRRVQVVQERKRRWEERPAPAEGLTIRFRFPDGTSTEAIFRPTETVECLLLAAGSHESASQDLRIQVASTGIVIGAETTTALEALDLNRTILNVEWIEDEEENADEFNEATLPGSPEIPQTPPRSPTPPPASPGEQRRVEIHRSAILTEMIDLFCEEGIMDTQLSFDFVNANGAGEKGVGVGVSREAYTLVFTELYKLCDGEEGRVPVVRAGMTDCHWQAIARIVVKAYRDVGILPLSLNNAFMVSALFGPEAVSQDILLDSLYSFVCEPERVLLKSALSWTLEEEEDSDELMDILSRFGIRKMPTRENIHQLLMDAASKELLQKPAYILDSFRRILSLCHKSFPSSVQRFLGALKSLRPTPKKVVSLFKANPTTLEQSTAFTYLKQYVKAMSSEVLTQFLRFVTGSSILCCDEIQVTFFEAHGLRRHPIARTCGPLLEIPSTYSSYAELRSELSAILNQDRFEFSIL